MSIIADRLKQKLIIWLKCKWRLHSLIDEKKYISNLIEGCDFKKIDNIKPHYVKNICIIIPGMTKYSGGHTSILRIGTYLCENGYNVDYVSYSNQTEEELKENAQFNLSNVKGNFKKFEKIKDNYDIVIATLWESVYYALKLKGYKMYFVQDFEPYFYTFGEMYWLAKETYEMGLHIVSLGKWNKKMIEKECEVTNTRIDYIDFPYEKKEYEFKERKVSNYQNVTTIKIAVYIKDDGKRFPSIIQSLLEKTYNELKKKGIDLDINYFGIDSKYKPSIGRNLGKLTKSELQNLYHNSHFGMVASMTNISLIPYEMIGCGLPIIEFKKGTFLEFFPEDCATLISFDYHDICNSLLYLINNPEKIVDTINYSYEYISQFSWQSTSKQFMKIIEEISNE